MSTDVLNRKPRFGALFWAVFFVTTPIVLLTFTPWEWDQPAITIVAACVALPILSSISVYVVVYFARALLRREVGRNEITALLVVSAYLVVGVLSLTFVETLAQHRAIGTAVLACTAILLFNIVKNMGASE